MNLSHIVAAVVVDVGQSRSLIDAAVSSEKVLACRATNILPNEAGRLTILISLIDTCDIIAY